MIRKRLGEFLFLALFGCGSPSAARHGETLAIADRVNVSKGSFLLYASPWSTFIAPQNAWTRGVEYEDSIVYSPRALPDGTTFFYRWPASGCSTGVCGYIAASYGNYDGASVPVPVRPRQISDVTTFREDYAVAHAGAGMAGLLNEFYLTRSAGDMSTKISEIGFFLHLTPEVVAFRASGDRLGSCTEPNGTIWSIVRNNGATIYGYITLAAPDNSDRLARSIDIKAVLLCLVGLHAIPSSAWVNGLAMGVEPSRGAGSMTIQRWRVVFD